jgi:hypothetical protein
MRRQLTALAALFLVTVHLPAQPKDAPSHDRPYFMPAAERDRIRGLIQKEAWARAEHDRLKAAADKNDGYAAAFLYALDGEAKYVPAATKWLLGKYGPEAYWVTTYKKHLADPNYFKGGQPGIPDVYYDLDVSGLLAYDWVYKGLADADRTRIEDGILTFARYKMRCMDRWTQTPNLVFKPTYLVAMTGLATRNRECLDWGFYRTKPWGSHIGGYYEVLNSMIKDGGPWNEAPIYPGAHTGLLITALMSRYRNLYDGQDWFRHKTPGGGSPRGLMDYYLDSAYPVERTGPGQGQVRVANYGDGSTNGAGDLFLVSPAGVPGNILLYEPLAAAYNVSGDSRYAAFLALLPDYKPDLWERRPLPAKTALPGAASKVWPDYGLAMLRSDESPGYWTSGKAIAVFQIMSQGYGHDHRDKFSISLHGAGRLFYPNYNAIQYENPTIGWTRNSVSHNTLVVDEQETRDATPTGIRHEFSPEVKFLATSASGVFEGVDQTRALLLTKEYLLDLFQASSKVPHTYDYLLHSFGKPRVVGANPFKPRAALVRRYWLVDNQQAMTTKEPWALDLVIKEEPGSRKGNYGKEWYDHTATVRVSMAGEPDTLVVHGTWGDELAKLTAARQPGAVLDRLTMLAARRSGVRDTVFAVVHEPYANAEKPQVTAVTTLDRTPSAVLVRVEGAGFTDYAAVAFGPQKQGDAYKLEGDKVSVLFRNYGHLRVSRDGAVTARGDWLHFRIPAAKGPLTVNGEKVMPTRQGGDFLVFGGPNRAEAADELRQQLPERPFPVTISPAVVRVFDRDRRKMMFTIRNTLKEAISGHFQFTLPEGLKVEPEVPEFGPIGPGATAEVAATFVSSNPTARRHTVPYRVSYRPASAAKSIRTAAQALVVMVGPTLEHVYQHPKPAVYQVHAPKYTAKFDMFHGLCRYLADDTDTVRLDGSPLFTFTDGKTDLLFEGTKHAFTWPRETPANLTAHALDRCRWQALFFGDRILIRMDPGWTQFEKAHFTIPGQWVAPGGAPRWQRIVAVEGGKEMDVQPGAKVKVAAAELAFPGAKWHLAFQFEPAQEVTFDGTKMTFQIGGLNNDNWQVGCCEPGKLDAWRGKK